MAGAHIDIEALAEHAEVSTKTVQRWLAGRTPYARHRWAVASLLDEDEHYLWPPVEIGGNGASPHVEVVGIYTHRADLEIAGWWSLFTGARHQIDVLGYAVQHLHEQHTELRTLLRAKAEASCSVRVALVDPTSPEATARDQEERLNGGLLARIRTSRFYFGELDDCQGVEIHFHRTPMYNSLFRFDDQMLVTPHLYGVHANRAPLLHLRRKGGAGMFDSYVQHFEDIWETSVPAPSARVEVS